MRRILPGYPLAPGRPGKPLAPALPGTPSKVDLIMCIIYLQVNSLTVTRSTLTTFIKVKRHVGFNTSEEKS